MHLLVIAGIFFNGLAALDITMGRKRMRLGEKLALAWRHLSLVLGLGTALYIVVLVPVLRGAEARRHAGAEHPRRERVSRGTKSD